MLTDLKTGDIVLFNCQKGIIGKFIQWITNSYYSHVGIVLKNPTFIKENLNGLYLWESGRESFGDSEDNQIKFGVQIVDLKKSIKSAIENNNYKVYYRKLLNKSDISNQQLKFIHELVHNKPYDILPTDWLEAYFNYDLHPKKKNRFWCSALVGFIYNKLNILSKDVDWSILKPNDFSSDSKLKFIDNIYLDKEILIENIENLNI